MPPLTRTQAEVRARLIDVQHYAVDLDLTGGGEFFGSTTVVKFTANEPGTSTFIEIKPGTLHRAVLNGTELDTRTLDGNHLPLTGLAADNELRVEADMRYSRTGEGLHRFTDPADGAVYTYSQSCLDEAQRIFACFDQPDLKAAFDVTVTAPQDWTVLSNGIGTRESSERRTFTTTPRLSTYLLAFAAGPYHSVHSEHAGLPFALHCRRSLAPHLDADAAEIFDITHRCFDRYHELFDEPYPFDSYDQAFVPEFNMGAMENPGLVTFRDEFVFRSAVTHTERRTRGMVIAHEMAHMWFGDLVTLRWWDDIWLNESFAEYMGYQVLTEATELRGAWTGFALNSKTGGYDADQRPSTHPVAPSADDVTDTASARSNFDGISYGKGAAAVRQLVAWLGEKPFLAGVNEHLNRHRFGNATLADFVDSLARASDRDVHGWAARWLRTPGIDTLTARVTDTGERDWTLAIDQHGSRPHRLAIGLYDEDPAVAGRLVSRDRTEWSVPDDRGSTLHGGRPALVLPNDGDLSYAKIRLDEASWTTARHALSGLPDPLSRAVLWTAARDRLRDGELPPADYLQLVGAHLPAETDIAIIEAVLGYARLTVIDRYLDPEHRADALTGLADAGTRLLQRATEQGDTGLRLAALRTLIASAADGQQAARIGDWLEHDEIPGGPALDPALRWRILLRLCVIGAADDSRIAAELARDPGSTGTESAARCRSALPTADAKQAAWQAMFDNDTLSNHLLTATAQGFWQPEQHAVLAPFTTDWFDTAAALAERRGGAIAMTLVRHGFPAHAAEEPVVRAGETCLARTDLEPTFRRWLTDQLDDLRRAVRVRAGS